MDKILYKSREKERPDGDFSYLGGFIATLVVSGAIALTIGYLYWAAIGSNSSKEPVKQPSQIEKVFEQQDINKEELSSLL